MGAQRPQTLEELRAQLDNPGAGGAFPPAVGPFYPQTNPQGPSPVTALPQPEPEGFDAGDIWVFPYNLNPYVDAKGEVPPPTQARIDRFMRNMAKLLLEYQEAAREAQEAQAKAEAASGEAGDEGSPAEERPRATVEEMLAEVDKALEEKNAAVDKIRAAIADLCNGHPTRKQLEKLPEYVLMKFSNALGRKLNPEG